MKFPLLFCFSSLAAVASAAPITGQLWSVSNDLASNAIFASIPNSAPNVTFQVNAPLDFTTAGSVNTFLTSGGAFNIVGSPADLSRAISPSLIEFTGQVDVTNGQNFTVTHDDGLTLSIGGISVIDVPGPTPPDITTAIYNGPTGNLPFTLVYGECCGGSAVLQISLPLQPPPPPPTGTPEPSTYLTAIGGLATLGFVRRFRRA